MALYVNTNVSSLHAQRQLSNTTLKLDTNYQHLSSGLRINTAKDDSAGLQVTESLTSQINGLDQGNRNTNDGLALAQTIDGSLEELSNLLQRIRTLSVQAANGTYMDSDRETMQKEANSLCAEISRIAEDTTFAGAQVLDGIGSNLNSSLINTKGQIDFQVGSNSYDLISIGLSKAYHMDGLSQQTNLHVTASADLGTPAGQAGFTGLVQTTNAAGDNIVRWSVSSMDAAQKTLENIDKFIQEVDLKRTDLGAVMNRMESTIRNYNNNSSNHSDSRSRMRDTDFASETATLTQNNIVQQASQSILSQANQQPAFVTSLLNS